MSLNGILYLSIKYLGEKTMAYIFMYTPNDDTQNYPFCRLQLEVETFEIST